MTDTAGAAGAGDAIEAVGFVGLGNMGGQLCANLVATGHAVLAYDAAGPERVPPGATAAGSVADLARHVTVVVCSLPDGAASESVAREIVAVPDRRVTHVVDTSTMGVTAARAVDALLAGAGVAFVDAPVSGGVAGAKARTLAVMYAGADAAVARVMPVLAGLSDTRRWVGDRPGLAQAVKLANNFLSATALAATSEAVAFGVSVGVDMATMVDVLDASSGRNTATSDKFPNHVVTGRYASGFTSSLMDKDLQLYVGAVHTQGTPATIGEVTAGIWSGFAAVEPGVDFTRIYPYVERNSVRASGPTARGDEGAPNAGGAS
ncbi:MAG: NAD(P)-dependent oxidoreductase [Actinomycetota bacterium]